MLALYRSGRQSEALEAYRETRRTLVDEIGIEPGRALRGLEQAILEQDPALETPREGEELAEHAASLGERPLGQIATKARRLQRFVLRREQGRLNGFEQEVRDSAHEFPSPLMHAAVLAFVCAYVGRETEAAAVLDESTSHDLSDWHFDEEWLSSVCLLAEACTQLEDVEHGAYLYDLLLPYGARNAVSIPEASFGSASRPLGLLASMLGRFTDAERHFEEALRMNALMGAAPWLERTREDYARMQSARGVYPT